MPSSINVNTFALYYRGSTTKLAASVSYAADTRTATLSPKNPLQNGVTDEAAVTTGARDLAGNPLVQQKKWSLPVSR